MRQRIMLLVALVLCFCFPTYAAESPPPPPTVEDLDSAEIEEIGSDRSWLRVRHQDQKLTILVRTKELTELLKQFSQGDRVKFQYKKEAGQNVLLALTAQATDLDGAEIEKISPDRSALQVRHQDQKLTILVKTKELTELLKEFGQGDQAWLRYKSEAGQKVLQDLSVKTVEVGVWRRLLVLILSAVGLVLAFWLVLGARLRDLIVGADNRYSNSKTQIVLWFLALITSYLAFSGLRWWAGHADFVGGIKIPQNLLLLSGLSALTFAAAKGITGSKVEKAGPKPLADAPNFPRDLLRDDQGRIDLGDFQMIVVTLLAVVVYVVEIFGFLGSLALHQTVTLPDVDTTILATFGLGQGAYLVKKMVNDIGGGKPEPGKDEKPSPGQPPAPKPPEGGGEPKGEPKEGDEKPSPGQPPAPKPPEGGGYGAG